MNSVFPNLCQKLAERNISNHDLAVHLALDDSTLEQKMQGLIPWLLSEAVKVCCLVGVSDAQFLFCTDYFTK